MAPHQDSTVHHLVPVAICLTAWLFTVLLTNERGRQPGGPAVQGQACPYMSVCNTAGTLTLDKMQNIRDSNHKTDLFHFLNVTVLNLIHKFSQIMPAQCNLQQIIVQKNIVTW